MRNVLKLLILALWAILVLPTVGEAGFDRKETITTTETHEFELAADGLVSLKTINGWVEIEAWNEPKVVIEVEKIGKGDDEDEIRKVLEAWEIRIESDPEAVKLKVEAPSKTRRHWREHGPSVQIHLTAKVPKNADVKASSINGRHVKIVDVAGSVNASNVNGQVDYRGNTQDLRCSTVNGKITASVDPLAPEARISLNTVNGSIRLFIPEDARANVRAHSLQGKIYSNLDLPKQTIHSFVGVTYKAKLGPGGAELKLETLNGPIRLLSLGSDPDAGEPIVARRAPRIHVPSVHGEDWKESFEAAMDAAASSIDEEVTEAVSEGVFAAGEALRETQEILENLEFDELASASELAREAAREAHRAAREGLREAQRAVRESQRETHRAVREAHRELRHAHRRGLFGSGTMQLEGVIEGDLNIREGKEEISVGTVEGNANLVTYAGDIEIDAVSGDAYLLTYGGEIEVGKVGGKLEAESYGGDIDIEHVAGPAILKTKGGDIDVETALSSLVAETLGGDIDLEDVRGAFRAVTKGGDIDARLSEVLKEGEVYVESLGGDLEISLPHGMGANLRLEIVVHQHDLDEDDILDTNIRGLKRSETREGRYVRIIYTGEINGGGPEVTLKTKLGEITLIESEAD